MCAEGQACPGGRAEPSPQGAPRSGEAEPASSGTSAAGAGPPRQALADENLTAVVLLVERFLADHRKPVAPRPTAGLLEGPSVVAEVRDGIVPHLRRELPALRGLRGDARAGLTVRLPVAVAFLALKDNA